MSLYKPADPLGLRCLVLRVFGMQHEPGNLVGIVLDDAIQENESRQHLAAHLSVPDTGFLCLKQETDTAVVGNLVTYSPAERLTFCVTTLLAAGAVRRYLLGSQLQKLGFSTDTGIFTVSSDAEEKDLWWLDASLSTQTAAPDELVYALAEIDINSKSFSHQPILTGNGRSRLYLPLKNMSELDRFVVDAVRLNDWCKAHSLTGLCPFVVKTPDEIAIRVFTTSLCGLEDVATGGAVLGLLAVETALGLNFADRINVVQGRTNSVRKGYFQLRPARAEQPASLGGQVQLVVDGHIKNRCPE